MLLDSARNEVLLFNDRYGMGRIYVSHGRDECLFSTEAKGLLKIRRELRALDPEGLAQYLVCDCPLGEKTLFRGVQTLPAGSLRVYRNGARVEAATYFDPARWEGQAALEDDVFLGPSCVLTNVSNPRSQIVRHALYEVTRLRRGAEPGAMLEHKRAQAGPFRPGKSKGLALVRRNLSEQQDQILDHDIPFLRQNINSRLKAVCLKGRRNYLCRRRFRRSDW